MESAMKKHEAKQKISSIQNQEQVENITSNLNRSRSIAVGTSFGGTTEISMRGNGDRFLYCIMQPVEVIELIHQLAANVGCHIALRPRDDFGSWREWRVSEAEKKHLNGHAPFVNDMAVFQQLGASGFNQEQAEAAIEKWLSQKKYKYDNAGTKMVKEVKNETVATNKPKNERKIKRPARAS